MKQLHNYVLIFGLFGTILSSYGSAINVYPLDLDVNYQSRFHDVQVYNVGNDKAYVALNIALVKHPGLPDQQEIPLQDNPYQVGLIVTPNKMVIPPGQMRMARMLYIGQPPEEDLVYKVRIAPATGQYVVISNNNGVNAGVNVIIAYSVNVFVRPLKPLVKMSLVRQGQDLRFENQGNTNVLIGYCQQCPTQDPKHCTSFDVSKRIYARETYHYQLPSALPVTCNQYFENTPQAKISSN